MACETGGLLCPKCKSSHMAVKDGRPREGAFRRRRRCQDCGTRVTTMEIMVEPGRIFAISPGGRVRMISMDDLRTRAVEAVEHAFRHVKDWAGAGDDGEV